MINYQMVLNWIIPNWQVALSLFLWLALATAFSFIANHHSRKQKFLNIIKAFGFLLFIETWRWFVLSYHGDPYTWRPLVLGAFAVLLMVMGDLLGFVIWTNSNLPSGWFWLRLAKWLKALAAASQTMATNNLHPAERKFLKKEREQAAKTVKQGAKLITNKEVEVEPASVVKEPKNATP